MTRSINMQIDGWQILSHLLDSSLSPLADSSNFSGSFLYSWRPLKMTSSKYFCWSCVSSSKITFYLTSYLNSGFWLLCWILFPSFGFIFFSFSASSACFFLASSSFSLVRALFAAVFSSRVFLRWSFSNLVMDDFPCKAWESSALSKWSRASAR